MHLDTLGEETSSIFLLHSRNHHAAPTSLPVNRRGHLASGGELEAVNHSGFRRSFVLWWLGTGETASASCQGQ